MFLFLKILDERVFKGRGFIGRLIKKKAIKAAEENLKKCFQAYVSARDQSSQRSSRALEELETFDKVMTGRMIALASVCLESDIVLLHKDYKEYKDAFKRILKFYSFINKDLPNSEDASEFFKQIYYAKLENPVLGKEIEDDINFMNEVYESADDELKMAAFQWHPKLHKKNL